MSLNEKEFTSIFDSLISVSKKEFETKNLPEQLMISNVFDEYSSPDDFSTMCIHQINMTIDAVLDKKGISDAFLQFLFKNYGFVKGHVTNILWQFKDCYGSADVTRNLVDSIVVCTTENRPIELNQKRALPPENTDEQDWIDLIKSCFALYYGNPKKYIEIRERILQNI